MPPCHQHDKQVFIKLSQEGAGENQHPKEASQLGCLLLLGSLPATTMLWQFTGGCPKDILVVLSSNNLQKWKNKNFLFLYISSLCAPLPPTWHK